MCARRFRPIPAALPVPSPPSSSARQRYGFGPGIHLDVGGASGATRHLQREYGRVAVARGPCELEVDISFDAAPETFQSSAVTEGGHKTARWRVALSPADATPLRAFIDLRG